jgi:hypothetical protein
VEVRVDLVFAFLLREVAVQIEHNLSLLNVYHHNLGGVYHFAEVISYVLHDAEGKELVYVVVSSETPAAQIQARELKLFHLFLRDLLQFLEFSSC